MPRLLDTEETINQTGPGAFTFSAVKVERLGASEYTLVTLILDLSGSVSGFADSILNMVKNVVNACKKSPRAENLLIRLITFNDTIEEIHGFRLLNDIDIDNDYKPFRCWGCTMLYDASYDGVGATIDYATKLVDDYDFNVNGIVFIATDGLNNKGSMTPGMIKKKNQDAIRQEKIESNRIILIKMNEPGSPDEAMVTKALEKFAKEADIDQFVNIGDATPEKLAKLGEFVSQSISSQSQSLGKGGPSQALVF